VHFFGLADDIKKLSTARKGKTPAKSEQETEALKVIVLKYVFKENN